MKNRFSITKLPSYYWFTCLLKTINIDSLNKCFMNLANELIEQAQTNVQNETNEIPIVQELITELDIKRKIVVADAASFVRNDKF